MSQKWTERREVVKQCEYCGNEFKTKDTRKRFCDRICAGRNKSPGRILSRDHKNKISASLKKFFENNPEKIRRGEKAAEAVAKYTRGRYRDPKNIYDMSHRTRAKLIRRLKISCSRCGWDEEVGDIHHIEGRKIADPHNHKRLSYLCPNCHRLAEAGKIDPKELISFQDQVGDRWRELYYG